MEYRQLGASGIKVSPLCLGTMMFGGRTSADDAATIIAQARDDGVNFIDTADVYNAGDSERIVGAAISADRDHWIVATKLGNTMGSDPNMMGLSRRWLTLACEASLSRMNIDAIDIYYLHREDLETPLEETVMALRDLLQAGKIRSYGLSNFRSWRVAEVCHIADQLGIPRPAVSQPYYNAFNRMPEVEHLPACAHFGLSVFPYSPVARGVLTGKYLPDMSKPDGSRAGSEDTRMMQTEWRQESLILAQHVKAHAEAQGISASQFAIAWLLNNQLVTGVIAGPRTLEQWQDYLPALAYAFTDEDEAFIESIVPAGHPSTPGYTDPEYPLEGRVV